MVPNDVHSAKLVKSPHIQQALVSQIIINIVDY